MSSTLVAAQASSTPARGTFQPLARAVEGGGPTLGAPSLLRGALGPWGAPANPAQSPGPSSAEPDGEAASRRQASCLGETVRFAEIARKLVERGEVAAARRVLAVALQGDVVDPECHRLARCLEPPRTRAHAARAGSGDLEFDWISAHSEEHRGRWVAVFGDRLLGSEPTLEGLLSRLRSLSLPRPPVLHLIPPAP